MVYTGKKIVIIKVTQDGIRTIIYIYKYIFINTIIYYKVLATMCLLI